MRMSVTIAAGLMAGMMAMSPALASGWQTLNDGDTEVRVFTSGPEDADRAIVVVHDWFGFTPFSESAVDHLADLGYRVAAVDLYNGESATTHPDAWALMQSLDADVVAGQIDLALEHMSADGRQLALMGFSMGVPHALDAASRNAASVSAVAVWYGDTALEEGEFVGVPVLAIYGSEDGPAAEQAAALSQALDAVGGEAEVFVYPGVGHAFAQHLFAQGGTYDAGATAASWALTENFLERRLD